MDILDFDELLFLDPYEDFDPDLDLMPDEYPGFWDDEFDEFDEDQEPQVLPGCGLCRFKFGSFDSVVVFNPMNPHLPETWEGEYIEPAGVWDLEKGYHSACVGLVAKDLFVGGSLDSAIWNATRYGDTSYVDGYTEPLPSFEANRLRRLKEMFAQEFMTVIGCRLPVEACENIGRYCLREYATRLIKDAWLKKGHFGPRDAAFRVTKSHAIWAQHVEFEGLQYIKSLSTTRRNESDTKLFEAPRGTPVNIYFAEDCFGIREVAITQDDNTPSLTQGEGLRWVVNRRKALPFWFKLKSDGLKLRDLTITKTKKVEANYRQRRWDVLPSNLKTYQLDTPVSGFQFTKEPIRAVDWNLPGCRGYSVLVDMNFICEIIPNNMEGPSRLMDVNNKHEGAWFYIPIDPDERVSELWLRNGEFPREDKLFAGWEVGVL